MFRVTCLMFTVICLVLYALYVCCFLWCYVFDKIYLMLRAGCSVLCLLLYVLQIDAELAWTDGTCIDKRGRKEHYIYIMGLRTH